VDAGGRSIFGCTVLLNCFNGEHFLKKLIMKTYHILIPLVALLTVCTPKSREWTALFNGKDLGNWDKHIGTPLKGLDSPVGPAGVDDVFSVAELDGEKVMRIAGNVNAAIATRESFGNYHFKMDFRYGEAVYTTRNSGLLYHSYGDFGVGLDTWMSSHELQLLTGNVGDSYRMGETFCEIPVVEKDSTTFVYAPSAGKMAFGMEERSKIARKMLDMEKPVGQWNTVELYCLDDMSVHVVNGVVVLVNYNSGKYVNGAVEPLTSGKIQFQSEGGEIFLRNLQIRDITALPEGLLP
jgi:hypothetical protein